MSAGPTATEAVMHAPAAPRAAAADQRLGVIYGVAAFGSWGLFPIYFKAIEHVPALEIVAHRIIWSAVFLLVVLAVRHKWAVFVTALCSWRTLGTLAATACLIAGNWLTFIWAVAHDQLLQVSLGYFINPLLNVLLGFAFLGERLRRWQTVSVALAVTGVAYLTISAGTLPGVALVLAGTFGFYGLLRKTAKADALVGLTVETVLLAPLSLVFLVFIMSRGQAAFLSGSTSTDVLLALAGVVTAVPLALFAAAARRLRYTTIGFIHYMAPTGQFLLAVFAYHEPFTAAHVVTFIFIWAGVAIYTIEAALTARAAPRPAPTAVLPE
ncbi:MAG: EamA family transporter RarD [Phycisphaerae bacterium]|jgi:chloramphenicol-sensitive protein RarD